MAKESPFRTVYVFLSWLTTVYWILCYVPYRASIVDVVSQKRLGPCPPWAYSLLIQIATKYKVQLWWVLQTKVVGSKRAVWLRWAEHVGPVSEFWRSLNAVESHSGRRLGSLCHITRVILSFQRQCDYTGKNKLERVCRDTWRTPGQEATTIGAGVVLVV